MIERRSVRRYDLYLQIVVRTQAFGRVSSYGGQTRDLSTKAVCFTLQHALAFGDGIEFTITAPFKTAVVLLSGSAKVSQVHRRREDTFRIVADVDWYEISRMGSSAEKIVATGFRASAS